MRVKFVLHNYTCFLVYLKLTLFQIGDVAVIDVSATTIAEDESNAQNIPSAESKGLPNRPMILIMK